MAQWGRIPRELAAKPGGAGIAGSGGTENMSDLEAKSPCASCGRRKKNGCNPRDRTTCKLWNKWFLRTWAAIQKTFEKNGVKKNATKPKTLYWHGQA